MEIFTLALSSGAAVYSSCFFEYFVSVLLDGLP